MRPLFEMAEVKDPESPPGHVVDHDLDGSRLTSDDAETDRGPCRARHSCQLYHGKPGMGPFPDRDRVVAEDELGHPDVVLRHDEAQRTGNGITGREGVAADRGHARLLVDDAQPAVVDPCCIMSIRVIILFE